MVLCTAALLASLAPARAEPPGVDWRTSDRPEGHGYCFGGQLVFGGLVIQGGRCYNFYLVRTGGAGFLGFGPPGPLLVPPGQVLRMGSPEQLRGLFIYLVPLPFVPAIGSPHAAQFINVQVAIPQPNRVVILVPRGAAGGARPVELGFSR
jgi:hypothetical protein